MKKNNEIHSITEVMEWLNRNGYVPFRWNQKFPCDPGDFTGRHEAVLMESGWVWAKSLAEGDYGS